MGKILIVMMLVAGCTTNELRPGEQRYADAQLEIATMRIGFDLCAKGFSANTDQSKSKAYCEVLDNGAYTTESGVRYQRYMMMQVEKAHRGEIGKDELIYTVSEKGRELEDENRKAWKDWERRNPTVTQMLLQNRGGSSSIPLPRQPTNCTSHAIGGGITSTNCY